MLWLLVIVPVVAGAGAAAAGRRAPGIALGALIATAGVGAWAAVAEAAASFAWSPSIDATASVSGFGRVMVVLVPVIAAPVVAYAAATETAARARLIGLLTAFAGAMELLVVAGDFVALLIGWELVGALSWALIAHDVRDPEAAGMAGHAFITTRAGDLGLYVAAGIAFASTGSFALTDVAGAGTGHLEIIAAGVVVAAAAKSAQAPLSPWLFSAMAGPTPVSALLHSSTMVAAGAYLLIRLGPSLDAVAWFGPAVIAIGLATALGGGLVAAVHRHPKRVLAASTSAQYGLMFVAVGAGSTVAAAAQLVTHAAFKSTLFLAAGTASHESGSEDLAAMRLGRRVPVVAAAAAAGALALAAVPPLGAAWSKEQVAGSAFEHSVALGAAVAVAAALSAFYALRWWLLSFGPGGPGDGSKSPAGTTAILIPAAITAALSLLWVPAVHDAGARLLGGRALPLHGAELAAAVAAFALAAAAAGALHRSGRLAEPAPARVGAIASGWLGLPAAGRYVVADPVLGLARALARFDDAVVDAGVRASVRIAAGASRLLRGRAELSVDGIVEGVAAATMKAASAARAADRGAVDAAVEALAGALGRSGAALRRLQSGLSHHYYVITAAGMAALALALALGSS